MKVFQRIASVLLVAAALPASASLVTLHTRESTAAAASAGSDAANAAYYRDTVQALLATPATAGYCDGAVLSFSNVNNQGACGGSAANLAYAFTVDFGVTATQGADFSLRVGPDFGKGGAVFLDGALLAVRTTDMWWAGSWGSPEQIFQVLDMSLDEGNHHLAIYGLEACCDGGQQAEYRIGNQAWTVFGRSDALSAQAAAVPEPTSVALVLAALAGIAGANVLRRRHG